MVFFNVLTWVVGAYLVATVNLIFGAWLKTIVFSVVAFVFVMVMTSGSRRSVWLNGAFALVIATGASIASRKMVW